MTEGRSDIQLLPWALLGVAVAAAVAVVRSPPPAGAFSAASASDDAASLPAARPASSSAPAAGTPAMPPLTAKERRDARLHIGHEQCEQGLKRYNELSGRAPTDPKALPMVGLCLRYGNLAWYECLLRASSQDDAVACNRRFLVPSP